MVMNNNLVKVGYDYLKVIEEIIDGRDIYRLFHVLNAIKLKENCNLGLRLAKSMVFGDKSWFYCYHDEVDPYRENAVDPIDSDEPFFSCYDTSEIYKVFDYLYIEENEMGAWQAYLLSNAMTLLPTTWHGGYIKRQYVFEAEDLHRERFPTLPFRPRIDFTDEYDVVPSVNISGTEAVVSCCYWNDWEGLVREIVNINMDKGRFHFGIPKSKKVLYKYNCGIMF